MTQLLMAFARCFASTRKGPRCRYRSKFGEFCGHHKLLKDDPYRRKETK